LQRETKDRSKHSQFLDPNGKKRTKAKLKSTMYVPCRDGEWNQFPPLKLVKSGAAMQLKKTSRSNNANRLHRSKSIGKIDRTNFLKIEKENTNENSETA
jgi:hypothetical protein